MYAVVSKPDLYSISVVNPAEVLSLDFSVAQKIHQTSTGYHSVQIV